MTTHVEPKFESLQMANDEVQSFPYLQEYQEGNDGHGKNWIDIAVDIHVSRPLPQTVERNDKTA